MTRTAVSLRMYAGALLLLLVGALLTAVGMTTAAVATASVVAVALLCGAVFTAVTARPAPRGRARPAVRARRVALPARCTPRTLTRLAPSPT